MIRRRFFGTQRLLDLNRIAAFFVVAALRPAGSFGHLFHEDRTVAIGTGGRRWACPTKRTCTQDNGRSRKTSCPSGICAP